MLESPAQIGPYRLLPPALGQGAMGVVYRARHLSSERPCALKTVTVTGALWMDGIRREIQALQHVRHPGIVRIHDHGIHDGVPWYAMDLLEGESLRAFGQRIWSRFRVSSQAPLAPTESPGTSSKRDTSTPSWTPPPSVPRRPPSAGGDLPEVVRIARRLCATLAFLHGEGFVNCDLKPENVILVGAHPVLIDFGLAARHPGSTSREAIEVRRAMSGTLPYMSPEQIRGDLVDARSDLYSLGCILYELLVGATPFAGSAGVIRDAHLTETPAPPSERASGVPQALDDLVMRLLRKPVAERPAFADEVASQLAEIASDTSRLSEYPPSRPYLYRPRFVGRDEALASFTVHRDDLLSGRGTFVLIGGESGVGKTRLMIEVGRAWSGDGIHVLTSETSQLVPESVGAAAQSPLYALRPLLRAIADRCRDGGPLVTDSLLGDRRAVLSAYEPLLSHLPPAAPGGLQRVVPGLSPEASRRWLFASLRETLAAFARECPLLWVLDDLGWADELSLDFLRSLSREYLESVPLLIVGTYRSEEASPEIASLAAMPFVAHWTLPRLPPAAVSHIVRDMLAMGDPAGELIDFVTRQSEGNPFFVGEYLRAAVTERAIFRDERHTWRTTSSNEGSTQSQVQLSLPNTLRELVEKRLRSLSPAGSHFALAAAVLGRDCDIALLREVAGLEDEASLLALNELLQRQVLEPPSTPTRARFAHDKLREVLYANAQAAGLVELHGRAAEAIERKDAGEESAAILGQHYAAARRPAAAATYFSLAAKAARAKYANGEAIRLYRAALRQVDQLVLSLSDEAGNWDARRRELLEDLGDSLVVGPDREGGRAAYNHAFELSPPSASVIRARLHRKMAKSWEMEAPEEALKRYAAALSELDGQPRDDGSVEDAQAARIRLDVYVDRMWVYYFLNQTHHMTSTVADVARALELHGLPNHRVRFFQIRALFAFREERYVMSERTLSFAREAMEASRIDEPMGYPMARFVYGFALLHQHRLTEAEEVLEDALRLAQRFGDLQAEVRCLAYLAVAARMAKRLEPTALRSERCTASAVQAGAAEYVALARANRAWVREREGDRQKAKADAEEAIHMWVPGFPFQWLALLPLLAIHNAEGNDAGRLTMLERLLHVSQQALPGPSSDALDRAVAHARGGRHPLAAMETTIALQRLSVTAFE
ncbi:MAG TPA: AAA family ATPase [Polyangiaceae bacterium]|nr:AAA family ATPase [Polyangiaceae bacterium]